MKSARTFFLVLVTAPDLPTARRLTRIALEARLAACVNLIPAVESHYWWKEKLEVGSEILMVIKTNRDKLARVERMILRHHPYDTPEVLAVPLASGNSGYLEWLTESVGAPARRTVRKRSR